MREETEELKITLVEKSEQLQEYRIKVLKQFIYLRVLQSVVFTKCLGYKIYPTAFGRHQGYS